MANTIKLKKYLDVIEEYVAAGAITPGHLVKFNSNGKVEFHDGENENAIPMFALEDELQGKTIDQAYAQDDPVQVWVAQRGEHVNALLAASEEVVAGDFLCSAGDGTLKKHVEDTDSGGVEVHGLQIVAQALEAVTTTASTARIKVRIV
jgi:hypothetical protein